ncbi:MAG: hypothetical protein QOE70_3919 [Chthoniobacter sp.]|jgi:hypothetical protein|nr:hypothetical protein [Chthoniobacter sp.]
MQWWFLWGWFVVLLIPGARSGGMNDPKLSRIEVEDEFGLASDSCASEPLAAIGPWSQAGEYAA